MITLTVVTAFFAIGFMVHGALTQSKQALRNVEVTPEPLTPMWR